MRVDGVGGHQFPGGIHHCNLDSGAQARIQPQHRFRASGCSQQQVFQVVAKYCNCFAFGFFAGLIEQVQQQMHMDFGAPCQPHCIAQPNIRSAATHFYPGMQGNPAFGIQMTGFGIVAGVKVKLQKLFTATTQQCQQTVRWNPCQRLCVVEIIAEFFTRQLFAFHHLGANHPFA